MDGQGEWNIFISLAQCFDLIEVCTLTGTNGITSTISTMMLSLVLLLLGPPATGKPGSVCCSVHWKVPEYLFDVCFDDVQYLCQQKHSTRTPSANTMFLSPAFVSMLLSNMLSTFTAQSGTSQGRSDLSGWTTMKWGRNQWKPCYSCSSSSKVSSLFMEHLFMLSAGVAWRYGARLLQGRARVRAPLIPAIFHIPTYFSCTSPGPSLPCCTCFAYQLEKNKDG